MDRNEHTEIEHPFERAQLGRAPFVIDGFETLPDVIRWTCPESGLTLETKGGTSCDYCGTGIKVVVWIRGACGTRFKVGTDCACRAAGDAGDHRMERKVAALEKKRAAALRNARNDAKLANLDRLLADDEVIARLRALPHPSPWAARKGLTMADYAAFIVDNAGVSGKVKLEREIRKIIG